MTKYARFVDQSLSQIGTDVRTIDVVDMKTYNLLPDWYANDDAFLERIFSPQLVAEWKERSQWFRPVPQHVQDGARFAGSDYADPSAYLNPDGTDGKGSIPEA